MNSARQFYFLWLLVFFGTIACNKKSEQTPSFLVIDSCFVNAKPAQGNNIHEISALQVYANQEFLGLFELPAKIPVLKTGQVKFQFIPYVRLNGSNNQWAPHRCFEASDSLLELTTLKESHINPTFVFKENVVIRFEEDFNDGNSKLRAIPSVSKGDTLLVADIPFHLNGRFTSINPAFVARFEDTDTAKFMDFGTFESFSNMPTDGRSVQFDFDINTAFPVQMSLIRTVSGGIPEVVPYLYINSTEGKWKRFYIDLVHELSGQTGSVSIQILFSANKPQGNFSNREIWMDNLRLSYLK